MNTYDFDVIILGCGPVGATLGNLLGSMDVRTCIVERDTTAHALPRAGHFDDEVMRVWQTIGLSGAMQPDVRVNPGMTFIGQNGERLLHWPRPMEVGSQAWHPSYRFHQPALEATLRQGLTRFADVRVMLGCEVIAIAPNVDRVELTRLAEGGERRLTARYLVGCDGGKSAVREAIGTTMEDLGSHERWLVVDVLLKRPRDDLGDFTIQYCDPGRPTTYGRGVGDRSRWELMVLPEDDADAIARPESVWRLLSRWITPEDADIERATVYTFHGLIAREWRRGRLLIAGDAAHLMPPFLGQGMCSGVRDASNLAWKLARVIRDNADPALLDTYQKERSPHVREYVELAMRLGAMVQTRDPERARERDAALARDPQVLKSIKPRLGESTLAIADGAGGQLSEQIRLRDGALLDDTVGNRFALLLRAQFAAGLSPTLLAEAKAAGVAVLADEGEAYLTALGVEGALIRPDRYVLATIDTPEDLAAAVATIDGLVGEVEPA